LLDFPVLAQHLSSNLGGHQRLVVHDLIFCKDYANGLAAFCFGVRASSAPCRNLSQNLRFLRYAYSLKTVSVAWHEA
jgi:hypothetical protein